jgi:hypothetical protein
MAVGSLRHGAPHHHRDVEGLDEILRHFQGCTCTCMVGMSVHITSRHGGSTSYQVSRPRTAGFLRVKFVRSGFQGVFLTNDVHF